MIALIAQAIGPSGSGSDPVHVVVSGSSSLVADLLTGGVTAVLGAAVGFGFGRLDRKSQRAQDRRSADLVDGTAQLAALVACVAELDEAQRLSTNPDRSITVDTKAFAVDAAAGGFEAAWVSATVGALNVVEASNRASTVTPEADQRALTNARADLMRSMSDVRSRLAELRLE